MSDPTTSPTPELAKTYEPGSVESRWYEHWLAHEFFTADPARVSEKRPAYSIVIPPPNVTGVLTLGHVLNNTIQDILARRARMLGKEVLWLPGTDHAGIATQNVVEKSLREERLMKHRDDLGREALLAKVWEWKEKYGGIILQQLRALGASCDWTRTRFTMDEEYSRCVSRVFVDLHQKGLIYRGKRMVNWCPATQTAVSDEEVVSTPQNGFLYYFRLEVVEEPGTYLTVASTRPETIPGDTGIAVNPTDPRYAHLIGKHARRPLPLEDQAPLPIVGDEAIDLAFGTGVLKVTPAHDRVDNEIGLRHGLPAVDVLHPNGKMNALAGRDLDGLDRFTARKKAAELLETLIYADGAPALVKAEPYQNNVGFSDRGGVPIEPRLSEQWFLKYPSQEASRAVVLDGAMRFYPERWSKTYDHWMGNLQDWCISRQLWWGHRIPVWYRKDDPARIHVDVNPPTDPDNWTQDPDVLDTWFSSWLWPFATMGWPEKTETLAKFYPTTDLVTGPDIIFFWVARMIMAGFEYLGELPFRNVYFTGIIRDKQGRKMSKSLGNSPNPLDLIAKYGADALRFGVMRSAPLGQDILFDEKNVELGRNFCTKLWNAARFRQMQGGAIEAEIVPALLTSDDKWILLRLDAAVREVTASLEEYRFSDAAQALYRFFWTEYCDWYLEASKAVLNGPDPARKQNTTAVMDYVLAHTLRLFHPFLPFISEELWHGLRYQTDMPLRQGGDTIMFAPWPKLLLEEERAYFGVDASDEQYVVAKQAVVSSGRALRRDFNIAPNVRTRFVLKPAAPLPDHEVETLRLLLNAEPLAIDGSYLPPKGTPSALTPLGELYFPLEGLIDPAAERARLEKDVTKTSADITQAEAKLANPAIVSKAPPEVVEEFRRRVSEGTTKLSKLRAMIASLE